MMRPEVQQSDVSLGPIRFPVVMRVICHAVAKSRRFCAEEALNSKPHLLVS